MRLKIEAENASGDEAETSVIIMNTEYLRSAKQVQIVQILAFNIRR
jgi:hypothetical protein